MEKFVFIPYEKYTKDNKDQKVSPKEETERSNKPSEATPEISEDKKTPPPGIPEKPTGYRWLTLPETQ